MRPLRVLSLFDGMSCGQVALRELGYPIKKYYASEVDKFAIAQTQLNFPETIQLGDVRNLEVDSILQDGDIDLLIGGSPCQSFSFAGKRVGMTTVENEEIYTLDRYLELKQQGFEFQGQSYLFWEYMRILRDLRKRNPNILFLLENVEMGKKWEEVLSTAIGIHGVHINAALVSAQNRKRIYWTNIRVKYHEDRLLPFSDIPQPEDRGIMLKDILETEVEEKYYLKDEVVQKLLEHKQRHKEAGHGFGAVFHDTAGKMGAVKVGGKGVDDFVKIEENPNLIIPEATKQGYVEIKPGEAFDYSQPNSKTRRGRKMSNKCNCITTQCSNSYLLYEGTKKEANSHLLKNITDTEGKAHTFLATSHKGAWANGMSLFVQRGVIRVDGSPKASQPDRVYSKDGKSPALGSNHFANTVNVALDFRIRRLTPTECARLQTVPEWYIWNCSATQQYKMLGNGWCVEVIKHIFSFLPEHFE